jgi:DNA-binding NarL/FixJ family response regulator
MRVVIAEDSVLLREGTTRLLEEAGIEVVGRAGDADELMRKVRAHKPDVAIVDIRMPPDYGSEGLQAAADIRRELPSTGVLILSQYVEEYYVTQLMSAGTEGVGYLLKDRVADVERFVDAVHRVAEGGSVLDPQVVAEMLGRRRPRGPLDTLTERERDVLGAMAEGLTNREIAGRMFVSERAVERHVTAIFEKLGLSAADGGHRRVLAVLAYLDG